MSGPGLGLRPRRRVMLLAIHLQVAWIIVVWIPVHMMDLEFASVACAGLALALAAPPADDLVPLLCGEQRHLHHSLPLGNATRHMYLVTAMHGLVRSSRCRRQPAAQMAPPRPRSKANPRPPARGYGPFPGWTPPTHLGAEDEVVSTVVSMPSRQAGNHDGGQRRRPGLRSSGVLAAACAGGSCTSPPSTSPPRSRSCIAPRRCVMIPSVGSPSTSSGSVAGSSATATVGSWRAPE